ncbi:MAG: dihydrodipicolinate synthase family protein [Litorilinea sp.]
MRAPEEIRAMLRGPVTSLHTPFLRDGAIDYASLRGLIDRGIAAGSTTIMLTYGNSLYSLLTEQEIADVTRAVVEHTAGRAVVVAADGVWWTGQTVAFARYAREAGADVLMVLPPDWAASCTADTFVAHYAAAAQEMPVMVVTNVFRRAPALGLEVVRRLRDATPGVIAVKDDLGGVFARKLCLQVADQWAVISGGQKQNHFDQVHYGCHAWLSTLAPFAPEITRHYWQAVQAQDWAAAHRVVRDYDIPFFEFITGMEGGFDAAIHAIYELTGLAQRWRRPPYHTATDAQLAQLADHLRNLGLGSSLTR